MRMISLPVAMEISGHDKRQSFYCWVDRYNKRNPGHIIFRRYGKVDQDTLIEALKRESRPASQREEAAANG